jgi:Flp pilus assembly protein TadG
MVVFLAAVGLCVDVSHFYVVNAELQNAADAASLAAASALNSQPSGIATTSTTRRRRSAPTTSPSPSISTGRT